MERDRSSRLKQGMRMGLLVFKESVKSFLSNNGFQMAMALGTQGLFAVIPLIFFAAYLLSNCAFLSETVSNGIENLIRHTFPQIDHFIPKELFSAIVQNASLQVVGVFTVLVSAMSLADTLRTAFLRVFKIEAEMTFIRDQFRNALAALVMCLVCAVLLLGEIAYSFIVTQFFQGLSFFTLLFGTVTSLIAATLCMFALFRTFPPVRLSFYQLLTASVVTAVLMVLMRLVFSLFISNDPEYGSVFGSLKALFIMNIWIYYCFIVILFGAEIMVNVSKKEALLLTTLFAGDVASSGRQNALLKQFIERYQFNDLICEEGEPGDSLYYLLSGSVQVSIKSNTLRVINKDNFFGEMSMLLGSPRTATVRAAENDTYVVRISQDNFEVILKENPKIVLSILKEMTQRLKLTNEHWF